MLRKIAATSTMTLCRLLNAELVKALALPAVKKRLLENGLDSLSNTPEQFAAYIRAETAKWAVVVKDANVKVD